MVHSKNGTTIRIMIRNKLVTVICLVVLVNSKERLGGDFMLCCYVV